MSNNVSDNVFFAILLLPYFVFPTLFTLSQQVLPEHSTRAHKSHRTSHVTLHVAKHDFARGEESMVLKLNQYLWW